MKKVCHPYHNTDVELETFLAHYLCTTVQLEMGISALLLQECSFTHLPSKRLSMEMLALRKQRLLPKYSPLARF